MVIAMMMVKLRVVFACEVFFVTFQCRFRVMRYSVVLWGESILGDRFFWVLVVCIFQVIEQEF